MFDPIGDFENIVDGLKPITLVPANGAAVPGITSLRRAVTHKEAAASNGRYTTSDTVFHVSTVDYAPRLPLGSQIIEAGGERWTVLEHAYQTLLARWRYVVRRLDTGLDVGNPGTVFREVATYAKSETGALEPTWVRDAAPTNVRFEPIEDSRQVENDIAHFPSRFVGYFETEIEITVKVRFVDTAKNIIYKPVKAMDREKLGELFAVECEVTRWPLS